MSDTNTIRLGRDASDEKQWAIKEGGLLAANTKTFTDYADRLTPVEFDVVRATTATRVNEAGLIETVAANVPRIDFTNDSKGELLVEPLRTNYINYSDGVTANYGGFGFSDQANTFGIGLTNEIVIPDNSRLDLTLGITPPPASDYKLSFYFKVGSGDIPNYGSGTSDDFYVQIAGASIDISNVEITAVPNKSGIYKLVATSTGASPALNDNRIVTNFTGQSTKTIYASGFQLEIGSYATSYIPTSGSAETRNADVIQKTGIASLLGQSEGSIYLEASVFSNAGTFAVGLSDQTLNNRALINVSQRNGFLRVNNVTQASITQGAAVINTYYKLALRYAVNNVAFYINGVQVGTDSSALTFASNNIDSMVFSEGLPSIGNLFYGRIRTLAIYDYALDNTELANITT